MSRVSYGEKEKTKCETSRVADMTEIAMADDPLPTWNDGRNKQAILDFVAAVTARLSVLLHALTAAPLARWYARRLQTAVPDAAELPSPELAPHRTPGKHRSFGIHQTDVT